MDVRSAAELLIRPFTELDAGDVAEIITNIGDARETLFFERTLALAATGVGDEFENALFSMKAISLIESICSPVGSYSWRQHHLLAFAPHYWDEDQQLLVQRVRSTK